MADNLNEVEWNDESLKLSDLVFLKGEKDKKKRIFILSPKPKVVRVHYRDGYFMCLSKYELKDGVQCRTKIAKCCELCGEPNLRFGVVVALYDTTKEGLAKAVYKDKPADMDYEFMIWSFGEKVFQSLKTKHIEWDITGRDLMISCTNEQYQNLEIDIMKSSWIKAIKGLGEKVKREYDLFKHKDVMPFLGRAISEADIILRVGADLGVKGAAAATENAEIGNKEFDSILNELDDETGGTKASKDTVENKLDEGKLED